MGFLDSLKAWFRSEAAELSDAKADLESKLDSDLSARERRLDETPSEAMERLQDEIAGNDSAFDAIEDRIGGTQAHADAVAELSDQPDVDDEE